MIIGVISFHQVGVESSRTVLDMQVAFLSVRPAKESRELQASVFTLCVMSALLPHKMIVPDRWVLRLDVSNLRVSANTEILVFCVLPATVLLDLNILIGQVILQVMLLCCMLSAGPVFSVPSNINVSRATTLISTTIVEE